MTYVRQLAAFPVGTSQVQDRLSILGSDLGMVLGSYETVLRDHAMAIDEIKGNLEDLHAFIDWVNGTYPEIMGQYKAVKDIQESANG